MSSSPNSPTSRAERRQQILGRAGVRQEKPTSLPGEDGLPVQVAIRELLAEEARDFELASSKGSELALGMLLQFSIVDPETHEPLFEVGDRAQLQKLGVLGLKEPLELIQELSGVTDADIEKAKRGFRNGQSTA